MRMQKQQRQKTHRKIRSRHLQDKQGKEKAAMGSPRLHPHPHGRPAGPGSLPPDKIQAQNDITARLGIKPNRTGKST